MRFHPIWLTATLLAGCAGSAATPQPAPTPASSATVPMPATPAIDLTGPGIDPQNLDRTCKPCDDFFQFANGGWVARNPVPPEYSIWTGFSEVAERNNVVLHRLLDSLSRIAPTATPGSNAQKVGDFYCACMDTVAIEAAGATPLTAALGRIAAVRDRRGLLAEIVRFHNEGIPAVFSFGSQQDAKDSREVIAGARQSGLGLPDRDYYTKIDNASVELRQAYEAHIAAMFGLLGDSPRTAKANARAVVGLETKLAAAQMTRVEQRDPTATYHRMTTAAAQQLTPNLDWSRYATGRGVDTLASLNIAQPDYFRTVNTLLRSVPVATWRQYLRWQLVHDAAPKLSSPFVAENFAFYSAKLSGTKAERPRWKRCLAATDDALGEALGQLYVEQTFTPEAKSRAQTMVANLALALDRRLAGLEWMGAETKARAKAKLTAFVRKIGYPDQWRDYSALTVARRGYLDNARRSAAFERTRQLAKIGQPVDRTEWGMTTPTVNAYYNGSKNEIVFPAGILQPPFFDPNADDAINYGGMGAVIGHEMTHGFDDKGRQYDDAGNLSDWWSPADAGAFTERAGRVERQFAGYTMLDTLYVNGKLTLGENIADLGGLTIAYDALQHAMSGKPRPTINGFTPEQRFFLGWAQIWRLNIRPEEARRRLVVDTHSPGRWRVIGPLANMPEFARAYGCRPGDPMVRPDSLRAQLW